MPTIRSRCQTIRFGPLPDDVVAKLLISQGRVDDPAEAQRLAAYCQGSPQQALELADPELWVFREGLLRQLAEPVLDSVRLAGSVSTFVSEAGKDAAPRRARLRQVVGFAAEFYRHLVLALSDSVPSQDAVLAQSIETAQVAWPGGFATAAACLDRCLEALGQTDRNANQATLIECWGG